MAKVTVMGTGLSEPEPTGKREALSYFWPSQSSSLPITRVLREQLIKQKCALQSPSPSRAQHSGFRLSGKSLVIGTGAIYEVTPG